MGYKIDLYANDGSPIGISPDDIYGQRGVGGAELAMMSWSEMMVQRGHEVRVYNSPSIPKTYNGVEYLPQRSFDPNDNRDIFIVYRSPNPYIKSAKASLKVHWSTDQHTIGNFSTDIFPYVDRVVCISPFHVEYHKERYGIKNSKIGYFDLGVRQGDYEFPVRDIDTEKEINFIFCSVPHRGLSYVQTMWSVIQEHLPQSKLIVTSDYTLWGTNNPDNHQYRLVFSSQDNVEFLGKIDRQKLVEKQAVSAIQFYPCVYEELFCISTAECQASGAIPITTNFGALETTNEWGIKIAGNPQNFDIQAEFIRSAIGLVSNKEFNQNRKKMALQARKRFDWNNICEQWERMFESGEYETSNS